MEIATVKKIHFIGVGGIGMSALARFFVHEGRTVSGSDRELSIITEGLEAVGVQVVYKQVAENITPDIDMVVFTEAMQHDHPEMVAARALGVPMMKQLLILPFSNAIKVSAAISRSLIIL